MAYRVADKQRWFDALMEKGHIPKMDNDVGDIDGLDICFLEFDDHNGPGCVACGMGWCWHCDDVDQIGQCDRGLIQ